MDDRSLVLVCSGFLFCIALLGLLKEKNIVKILISLELMVISAILNFCSVSEESFVEFGYVAAVVAAIIGGIIFCIIFSIFCINFKTSINIEKLFDKNDDI